MAEQGLLRFVQLAHQVEHRGAWGSELLYTAHRQHRRATKAAQKGGSVPINAFGLYFFSGDINKLIF